MSYGKNEFKKNWGDRELVDNWRWSSRARSSAQIGNDTTIDEETVEDETLDVQYYISQIPSEQSAIDSIMRIRNDAYYQLGVIYKEKFNEYQLSKYKFKDLLASNPDEKYIVPSKYNLYKIYQETGESSEAEIVKNDIIANYPETRYAQILKNPELTSENFETPESIYDKLYEQFENQEYQAVIDQCEEKINVFEGDPMVPKFELLKATTSGRLYGYDAYAKGINYVALTYPNTEEGKQAAQVSSQVLPKLADNTFAQDSLVSSYKAVFKFNNSQNKEIVEMKKQLDEMAEEINYFDLKTSIDVYDPNTKFLVVHGLKSYGGALGLIERLEKTTKSKVSVPYFSISSPNYRVVQIHKNLDAYLSRNTN